MVMWASGLFLWTFVAVMDALYSSATPPGQANLETRLCFLSLFEFLINSLYCELKKGRDATKSKEIMGPETDPMNTSELVNTSAKFC